MKRLHLFEFEDLKWFPDVIRKGGTDYLRYLLIATELYKPILSLLRETLAQSGENKIIDLCSGGGGYIEQIYEGLGKRIPITLTDKFPNKDAFNLINHKTGGGITYVATSVDATNVPSNLKGFRVMFSATHHFTGDELKSILKNAVTSDASIAFFDGGEKNILVIIGMIIFHPIAFFLFTPFFRPFSFARLFFTYFIPLIPIYTVWDGCVSILRLYQPDELKKIAESVEANNYYWKSGKTRSRFGIHATYLIGYRQSD